MGADENHRVIPLAVVASPVIPPPLEAIDPADVPLDRRVKQRYDALAKQGASTLCCAPGQVYHSDELRDIPNWVLELSSGCGAPLRGIPLSPGQTVVDLGCGAGVDLLLAARQVGRSGRVVGIDASPHMVKIARRAAAEVGLDNVEVRVGDIRRPPVQAASADVVITNCVLAMFPDKATILSGLAAMLKPGGFAVVSDVLRDRPDQVPPADSSEAWEECVVGLTEEEYTALLLASGFSEVDVVQRSRIAYRNGAEVLNVKAIARRASDGDCCG